MAKRSLRSAVVVVCDSLRRDMIKAATAPFLCELAAQSAVFENMRPVFPSVTRASAPSLATGCYPGRHGIVGLTMVIDEGYGLICLSVGQPDFVERLRSARGFVLRRSTLAEMLVQSGGMVAYSNVSAGAAQLLDPEGYGFVFHRQGSFGPARVPINDERHLHVSLGADGDRIMTGRLCEMLTTKPPAVSVLWLSEPDETGHAAPLGSPRHLEAIKSSDECVRQVFDVVAKIDPDAENILRIVGSDHGMNTVARRIDVTAELVRAGLKKTMSSSDVVVAPSGTAANIYLSHQAKSQLGSLTEFLRRQDWVARVLSGDEMRNAHLHPDQELSITLAMRDYENVNEFGVAGCSDLAVGPGKLSGPIGVGQHGGLGVGEQQPFLFIRGAGFTAGQRFEDASLVDLAPTILEHLSLVPPAMDGKSLFPM